MPKKNIFYSKKHAPEEIIIIDKINFITFLLSLFFYKTKIIFFTKTNTTREKFLFAIFDFIKKSYKVDSINYDNNPSFYKKVHKSSFKLTTEIIDERYDDILGSFIRNNLYNSLFKINEIEVFFKQKYNIKNIYINYINPLNNKNQLSKFQKKIKFYRWLNCRLNDLPESSLDRMSLDKSIINKIKWIIPLLKINILFKPNKPMYGKILYCCDRNYRRNKNNNIFSKFNKKTDIFYNIEEQKIYFKNQFINFYSLEFSEIFNYLKYLYQSVNKNWDILKKYKIINLYDFVLLSKNIFLRKSL